MDDVESIKYKPKEQFDYAISLFEDLKTAVSFDPKISDCWSDEYQFKWRDYQRGEEGGIKLFEFLDF